MSAADNTNTASSSISYVSPHHSKAADLPVATALTLTLFPLPSIYRTHTHSNAVKGSGAWAPGTTVREIEGHFHKENEPKDVEPISKDGGVPNVGEWL